MVDTAGDSVFGEFDSVVNAVRCAQAIQDTQAAVNAARPGEEHIETRIGVHLGDVIVQDYQVYGDGVNIAARLQALADPGSICVSEAVYQQVFQKLDLTFEDLGIQKLKNIEYPIRLYRVVVDGYDPRKGDEGAACGRPSDAGSAPAPACSRFVERRLSDPGGPHPARPGIVPAHGALRSLSFSPRRPGPYGRHNSRRHRGWSHSDAQDRAARLFPHSPRRRDHFGGGIHALEWSMELAARCRWFDRRCPGFEGARAHRARSPAGP